MVKIKRMGFDTVNVKQLMIMIDISVRSKSFKQPKLILYVGIFSRTDYLSKNISIINVCTKSSIFISCKQDQICF